MLCAQAPAYSQGNTTPPAITLNDTNGSPVFSSLPSPLVGKVYDAGGIYGLLSVRLYRNHSGTYERWTGGGWVNFHSGPDAWWSAPTTPTGEAGTHRWSVEVPWPSGADLRDGTYTIAVTAWDHVYNRTDIHRTVRIGAPDTAAPAIVISSPAHGEVVENSPGSFESITGTVNDGAGVSVAYVDIYLARTWYESTQWWNGSAWGGWHRFRVTPSAPAADGAQSWSLSGMPSGEQLTTGFYYLDVLAYDYNGNQSFARHVFFVAPFDDVKPTVDVTFPAEGQQLYGLSAIRGTSHDDGSGVTKVNVMLARVEHGEAGASTLWYWNGGSWGTQPTAGATLPSVLDTGWTRNQNLPSGAELPPGHYVVMCQAIDRYNNIGVLNRNFLIVPVPPLSIDAHIRADETGAWLGEGFSNADAQGQTLNGTIVGGETQRRQIRIVRSGGDQISKSVRVTISDWQTFADAGCTASFTDARSSIDITSEITGKHGWSTVMVDGDEKIIRAEITAPANVTQGATGVLTFRVEADPTSETPALDVVKATWTATVPTPDLSIRGNAAGAWLGEGVVNADGAQQTLERTVEPNQAVQGQIKLAVADATEGQMVRWSVPGWAAFAAQGWQARFWDAPVGGNEITAQITGEGWTTQHNAGYEPVIRFEASAPADTSDVTRELKVRAQIGEGAADVVKAELRVLASAQPDVAIHRVNAKKSIPDWVGADQISPTEQKLRVVFGIGETQKFVLRVTNKGVTATQFLLKKPELPAGWTLVIYDAPEGGNLLSATNQGFLTSEIAIGEGEVWRLEVEATGAATSRVNVPLRFSSGSKFDQCEIDMAQQSIAGLTWTIDGVNSQGTGKDDLVRIEQNSTIGVHATKSLPDLPWPDSNPAGPYWTWGGVRAIGNSVWVQGKEISVISGEKVTATLGALDTKELMVQARPDLTVSLGVSRNGLLAGAGPQNLKETVVSASVVKNIEELKGKVKVRLEAFSESALATGKWEGADVPYVDVEMELGSSNAAHWTTGNEDGQITFKATVLDEDEKPRAIEDEAHILAHKPYTQIRFGNWRQENGAWSRTVTASTWFKDEKLGAIPITLTTPVKDYETEAIVPGWSNAAPFNAAQGTTDATGNFSTVQRWNPPEADAWPHDFLIEAGAQLR